MALMHRGHLFCPTIPWCVILLCQVHSLPPALTLRPAMRGISQIRTLQPGLKGPPAPRISLSLAVGGWRNQGKPESGRGSRVRAARTGRREGTEGEDAGGRRQEDVQDVRKEGEPGTYRPTERSPRAGRRKEKEEDSACQRERMRSGHCSQGHF